MKNPTAIAPLTKVKLEMEVVPDLPGTPAPADRSTFSFVCGLAIEGITAFEKELQGMLPGDRIELTVEPASLDPYFEHLARPLLATIQVDPPFKLLIETVSVEPVSERELVRALAQKTEAGDSNCGCGGGCGCGTRRWTKRYQIY